MSKCSPGAIKNIMKIMMVELHSILRFIEGFHNGTELAFDPLVISIHLLVKTEKKLSGIHHPRSNMTWRMGFSVIP